MKLGLVIYGSLDTVSGGYYYDRRLVSSLREFGDELQIISLPRRSYPAALADNLSFRLPPGLDLLIQDELNHPSLLGANRRPHPYPIVSLVHHLRACERPPTLLTTFSRRLERRYLRSVDGFICNSRTTMKAVQALSGQSRPGLVAFPPLDRFQSRLSPAEVSGRAHAPGPLRLLFLGNLIPRKGLHTLLAALTYLPPGTVSLEVIGSPAAEPRYAARIRKQVTDLAGHASIRMHGILEEADLQAQMEQAQLLVVPSSYEGFGIVYAEGLACGLPALASNAGAAGEVIQSGQTGFLVPPGDPAALAAHLLTFQRERDLLARFSCAALACYYDLPRWEQSVTQIRAFLSERAGSHE